MKYMEGKRGGKRRSEDEGEVLVATSLTWMVLTTFSQLYTWRGHLMILVWVCILHTDTCPIGITSIKGRSKTIHKKLCVAMVTGGDRACPSSRTSIWHSTWRLTGLHVFTMRTS